MTETILPIPVRLENIAVGGHVAGASAIIDDAKDMTQDEINAAVDTVIGDDETEGTILGRIKALEDAEPSIGSVNKVKVGDDEYSPINGTVSLPAYPTTLPASDVSAWAKSANKPSYSYSEITNTPTLGTAASKDVPESGNASNTQVVMGDDTRLSDARPSSDVYSWAKEENKPSYSYSEIANTPTLGTAASKNSTDTYSSTGADLTTGKAVAAALGTLDVTGEVSISANKTIQAWSETDGKVSITTQNISITKSQVSDFPTLGTASAKDVPTSGNASTTQVVLGNDTRLSDSRPASDVSSWAKASTKPSYTASEVGAIASTEKGANNGVAELDATGKVPSSQLPSYVDDVLEYDSQSAFPSTGESGKIYVDKSTSTTWRWSGSAYTQIKGDLVIGTTTGTAADGGTASAHYSNTSNPHSVTKSQVGLGSVVNTGDSATPVSGGTTKFTTGGAYTELNKKVDKVTGKDLSTNDYTTDEKNKLAGIATGATNVTTDTVSEWGYTKNVGTVTGIKMNDTTKSPSSGVVDLGTIITSHQDISGKVDTTTTVNGHALSSNVTVTKSDIGLGSVGNFKAVSTDASQELTDTEKSNARANIGAGTSSFSGSYNDLSNKPTIPAAANNGTYTVKTLVGSTTTDVSDFTANQSDTDDVTFVQGSNVTITPDATNRKITIAAKDTTYTPLSLGFCYGECSTAADTAAKTVTMESYNLVAHGIVSIRFTNAITVANATLNINSKGEKAIYYKGAALGANIVGAGSIVVMQYNGSQYHIVSIEAPIITTSEIDTLLAD